MFLSAQTCSKSPKSTVSGLLCGVSLQRGRVCITGLTPVDPVGGTWPFVTAAAPWHTQQLALALARSGGGGLLHKSLYFGVISPVGLWEGSESLQMRTSGTNIKRISPSPFILKTERHAKKERSFITRLWGGVCPRDHENKQLISKSLCLRIIQTHSL